MITNNVVQKLTNCKDITISNLILFLIKANPFRVLIYTTTKKISFSTLSMAVETFLIPYVYNYFGVDKKSPKSSPPIHTRTCV